MGLLLSPLRVTVSGVSRMSAASSWYATHCGTRCPSLVAIRMYSLNRSLPSFRGPSGASRSTSPVEAAMRLENAACFWSGSQVEPASWVSVRCFIWLTKALNSSGERWLSLLASAALARFRSQPGLKASVDRGAAPVPMSARIFWRFSLLTNLRSFGFARYFSSSATETLPSFLPAASASVSNWCCQESGFQPNFVSRSLIGTGCVCGVVPEAAAVAVVLVDFRALPLPSTLAMTAAFYAFSGGRGERVTLPGGPGAPFPENPPEHSMAYDINRLMQLSTAVDITDLDWAYISRVGITDQEARCLRYLSDIESHAILYQGDLLAGHTKLDYELVAFLSCWAYEEMHHGWALDKFLTACGRGPAANHYATVTRKA